MSDLFLILIFAKIAALTFGGGYAMVPLFESELVRHYALLSAEDFANLVGLAQVTPGPIGFNSATYAGMLHGGWLGALAASLGVIIPSLVISLVVAVFLKKMAHADWLKLLMKGVRPCVVGIIAAAVIFFADNSVFSMPFAEMIRTHHLALCLPGTVIFALVVAFRLKFPALNPVWLLVASALLGWVLM